jgi:beta-glucosidase/6-phospho-beta-glucosidase/beta-galactosidase
MSTSTRERTQNGSAISADHLFRSFFMAGFECSTHQLATGRRLDLVHATQHDRFCELDYRRMVDLGLKVAREGLRWHLIERRAGQYDFSTAKPFMKAAQATGVQVIWDLCHYGWPEDIDIYKPEFVRRFARMAKAFAQWLANETDELTVITPINEISFFAWAGGESAYMNPYCKGRSFELKVQLARAAIEAMEAVWAVMPDARYTIIDPIVHVIPHPNRPEDNHAAAAHRAAQFQGWDLLSGRLWPQIGGDEKYLDIVGINYYPDNQWIKGFGLITRDHPLYLPFSELILEVYHRYQRPMFIAETGAENRKRPDWLKYICDEVRTAVRRGVDLKGICLYPILNHPGWDNDRHCHNGLWDYADDEGEREIYEPLAEELKKQGARFESHPEVVASELAPEEGSTPRTDPSIPMGNLPGVTAARRG